MKRDQSYMISIEKATGGLESADVWGDQDDVSRNFFKDLNQVDPQWVQTGFKCT